MDFGSIVGNTTFDADAALSSQGGILPDMKNVVFGILGYEEKSNDSGWQAVRFELQIVNDGANGSFNGRKAYHQITVKNPQYPQYEQYGIDELIRWAAATGQTKLGAADDFVGRQFMANVGHKFPKGDTTKDPEQTFRQLKKVEVAGTVQQSAPASAPQQQPQQPQQPQGFGAQGGGFGQQSGGFGAQTKPF